ncbi:response regulator [Oceanicella sp. SM1341]|uniref:response regulator n=1 Tax=Oceanicella sp. SM1341 TaxID=1548889 RepID=UPI000E53FDA2|nr:response regulator [Oceanicella sp. SM1341]
MTAARGVVAVVDDDSRMLESLEDLLESAAFTPRCFSTAGGLLAGGLADVDVLISDVGMAGMDGFELLARVRRMRPGLPVFLITGRHEIAEQPRAGSIRGFFRKPFDGRLLLAAIEEALNDRKDGG